MIPTTDKTVSIIVTIAVIISSIFCILFKNNKKQKKAIIPKKIFIKIFQFIFFIRKGGLNIVRPS